MSKFNNQYYLFANWKMYLDLDESVAMSAALKKEADGFANDAKMVKTVGAEYCLVGHSERRHLFGETGHQTRQKIEAALAVGLTPVLCVGEKTEEKKDGKTLIVVEEQIRAALDGVLWPSDRELVVAYEPVWAIGTGLACDPVEV